MRVVSALVGVGALSAGFLSVAQATIADTPTKTWGIGPATATSASTAKPRVLTILPVGDRIFVGGTFDSVISPSGQSYPAKNIAVFSASTGVADTSFKVTANNTVTSLASDGTSLFMGGTFGSVNSQPHAGLAAVDISSGAVSSWSPAVTTGQVDQVAYAAGSVFAGGNFTSITGGGSTSQPYVAKIDKTTGAVDKSWATAPNDRVRSVNVAADGSQRLYLGGDFTSVGNAVGTNKLAAVSVATGAVDSTFRAAATNEGAYAPVFDVTSDQNRVYVAAAGSGGACTALNRSTGALAWSAHSNGNMQSVRLLAGELYCGGHFSGAGSFLGQSREKLAAVDSATGALTAFNPRINSSQGTWALASDATHLYVGGDFSTISRVSQPHYAVFTDSSAVTAPLSPENLRAQPGSSVVHLSWSAPSSDGGSPLLKYKVYRSTTPGGQRLDRAPLVAQSDSARTFEDTTVSNGTTYYYRVVAVNAVGSSPASGEASATPTATTVATTPSAPTSLVATNPAGYNHLQWNPPTDNGGAPITSYRIYRGVSAGGEGSTPIGTVSTTSFNDVDNVVAGTTYYYVVKAVNAAGEGIRSSEVSATVTPGTPGPPVLAAAASSGPAVQLSWTVPSDGGSAITRYVITRDGVRLATLPATATGPTAYADTAVSSGATYTYQVKAVNGVGGGQQSNRAVVTV